MPLNKCKIILIFVIVWTIHKFRWNSNYLHKCHHEGHFNNNFVHIFGWIFKMWTKVECCWYWVIGCGYSSVWRLWYALYWNNFDQGKNLVCTYFSLKNKCTYTNLLYMNTGLWKFGLLFDSMVNGKFWWRSCRLLWGTFSIGWMCQFWILWRKWRPRYQHDHISSRVCLHFVSCLFTFLLSLFTFFV